MAKASELIKQAQAWLGKNEADGSHKEIIDIYNKHTPLARSYKVKYTDSWCATFISALAIKCKATDIIATECSCQKMIELFKDLGVWVENENRTPSTGDIIFYDWQDDGKGDNTGWSDHVGIVESVKSDKITVIEGNISNKVGRRTIAVNGKNIRGYAVPKYEKEAVAVASPAYYPAYSGDSTSLDAILEAIGVPSEYRGNYKKRVPLAEAQGIVNYEGTEEQNSKLKALARSGKLKRVVVSAYYPAYSGDSTSLDAILEAIGVPAKYLGSYINRTPLAQVNGFSTGYVGSYTQNRQLGTLAKQGKLKRV